ncbi:MAG: type II toxin-antitoxin system HipA family toxin [Oscillospiraceae bacterium]|nr:type II toxin-antitoxin system HipA family toxin [Oscillospiraceae bacterium]
MKELHVSIEKNGELVPVGTITGEAASDARFRYLDEYRNGNGTPVSVSLPMQEDDFTAEQTASYFEGLLPEGFTRRTVAQWMHVDEGDYLSILHGLGRECLGAVCITDDSDSVGASYERITEAEVQELAAEGASKSAELVTKSHLSLTGASGKVGLYYDARTGTWYLPRGTAPSTHIVKQSHVRLEAIVTNEKLSLMTAARCGLDTPDSFIINTGKGKEHEVLFATQRYDRMFEPGGAVIDGMPKPYRLHQEDFAQAMGIPATAKYEKEPRGYLKGMFEILRKHSADPITDQLKLWDIIVFDYLIGNTDAHIKNFSLLYGKDLKQIRLAPAYDIVSTVIYEQSTRDMAFSIGGALSLDELTRDSFRQSAQEVGLGERMAMRRFDAMAERFRAALHAASEDLQASGYPKAAEIEGRILQTAGIRSVL